MIADRYPLWSRWAGAGFWRDPRGASWGGLQKRAAMGGCTVDNARIAQHRPAERNGGGDIARSDQPDLVRWRKAYIDKTGDQQHRNRRAEIEKIIEDAAEHGALRRPVKG